MSEFKEIKRCWTWIEQTKNTLAILQDQNGEQVCNFGDIANFYPTAGIEPDNYNAKLIAAAPEMLEMLEKLSKQIENEHVSDWLLELKDNADDLIKKATEL